jgi:isopentenyl diphosphate isomerase/L-lactate dehydrogenase-like FMN-dependent dehydrogenase
VEGGAGREVTLRANLESVASLGFRPRVGVTPGGAPDLRTTVLGTEVSMPLLLSPIGFTRMMHPAGDRGAAKAAADAGTIFTQSSMSGHRMDEVMAAGGPAWFQLYFLGGRDGAAELVARARDIGFSALVITMDTQVPGDRRRETRYRFAPPLRLDARTAMRMAPFVATRPRWLLDIARDRFHLDLEHASGLSAQGSPISAGEALLRWISEPPSWQDVTRIREQFGGPVIVKGVVLPEDARRAVDSGASAIVVSNHGGRQLDGAPATFEVLEAMVQAVAGGAEVLVDGGIRSGADVVKGVALGARAALIGRAWAYGLCAAGQPGVRRVLSLFREDIDRTMRLLGVARVADIDRELVTRP